MKSYRELIEKFYSKDLIGSWKYGQMGEYSLHSYIFITVLFIGCMIFYFNFDIFNMRPINQTYCFSNTLQDEVNLLDIVKTEQRRRNIAFDYSEMIRKENITIEFVGIIKEIKNSDNKWQIVTEPIYAINVDETKSFAIWLNEIPNLIDLEQGDKIKIRGSLNGINKDWIIISDAEVIK